MYVSLLIETRAAPYVERIDLWRIGTFLSIDSVHGSPI